MKHFKRLKLFTAVVAMSLLLMVPQGWGQTRGDETIYGNKTFEHNITVKKDLTVEGATIGVNNYSTVYYVCSTNGHDSGGYGKTYLKPYATVDYAINKCTANKGDIIYILPGHAESFSAANGFDADVAGISIIGLGSGVDMPEFTFADTDATIAVGADGVTLANLRFIAGISDIVMGISVEAAGDNCTILNCEWPIPGTNSFEFLDAIDLATTVDNFVIKGCKYRDGTASASNHFIEAGTGTNPGLTILNNDIQGRFAVSAIWSDEIDLGCLIGKNTIFNSISGQHCIEFTTTATGMIFNNRLYGDTIGAILDPGSMYCSDNLASTAIDEAALPIPAVGDSTDNYIGTDNADNDAATTSIVANENGSVLERLEQIQEGVNIGTGASLPANKSLFDIIGETYTDDGGADHLDDVYAHLNLIMKYVADGSGGGAIVGANPPAGKSLFDIIGDEYTDDGGNDNLDSVAAHLNLLSKYVADGDGDFATGTALASNKSLVDAIGSNGTTVVDSATGVAGMIGVNDADNAMSTSSVVSNADGSVFERLEFVQTMNGQAYLFPVTSSADTTHFVSTNAIGFGDGYFVTGFMALVVYDAGGANAAPEGEMVDITGYASSTGTFTIGATTALAAGDIVMVARDESFAAGMNAADAASDFSSSAVAANSNGTILERLEALAVSNMPNYNHPNYLAVSTGTFDTSGTWSTAASHEIATVTGAVMMTILPQITTTVVSVSDTGTLTLGDETTADSLITVTTMGSGLGATGEWWVDDSLADTVVIGSQVEALTFVVGNGKDIGYTVATNAMSGGAITFHIWWTPLDATGSVVAGAGGTL